MLEIKKLMTVIHKMNVEKGFWGENENKSERNKGELLMLIVSELSEALEADRNGKWFSNKDEESKIDIMNTLQHYPSLEIYNECFKENIKDTFEDEIADSVIRLLDLAEGFKIDLEYHIMHKLKYNSTRPIKHSKKY